MSYNIDEYSKEGILNPGGFLIAIIIYSSRYVLYGPLSLLASRRGRGSSGANLDFSFLTVDSPLEMLVSIPAVIILFILVLRSKDSKPIVRKVWKHGRLLLILGALGQLVLLAAELLGSKHVEPILLAAGTFNFYVLYYFASARRVKDVFSMFPGGPDAQGTPG